MKIPRYLIPLLLAVLLITLLVPILAIKSNASSNSIYNENGLEVIVNNTNNVLSYAIYHDNKIALVISNGQINTTPKIQDSNLPEKPTPAYIWIIIAVGAVLVIATIVLIAGTRRI
jgi:hypothetical protein